MVLPPARFHNRPRADGNASDLLTEMSEITKNALAVSFSPPSCRRLKCVTTSSHDNPLENGKKKQNRKKSTRSIVNAQAFLHLPSEGTANEKRINMKTFNTKMQIKDKSSIHSQRALVDCWILGARGNN